MTPDERYKRISETDAEIRELVAQMIAQLEVIRASNTRLKQLTEYVCGLPLDLPFGPTETKP